MDRNNNDESYVAIASKNRDHINFLHKFKVTHGLSSCTELLEEFPDGFYLIDDSQ